MIISIIRELPFIFRRLKERYLEFDAWIWDGSTYSRDEKSQNFYKANSRTSDGTLALIRLGALLSQLITDLDYYLNYYDVKP